MKFKKAFSVILAVAMVITLMPSMAFATTTNTVSKVPTVAADTGMPANDIYLEVKDAAGIKEDTAQKIKLTFNNAKWASNPTAIGAAEGTIVDKNNNPVLTVATSPGDDDIILEFISASDNTLEFSVETDVVMEKTFFYTLSIVDKALKSGTEDGAVEIVIDGLDSSISGSVLTIANVASSTTTADVNGTTKVFPRENSVDVGTSIEIRETAVNSIKKGSTQTVEFRLPKGVTWDNANTVISGDMSDNIIGQDADGRILTVVFETTGIDADDVRNVLVVKPVINITKDAAEGDIAVQIVGKDADNDAKTISDANDLVIATYGNESVTVSAVEEIPNIITGYTEDTKGKAFKVEVNVKEAMKGSLSANRYVDFDFPAEVQIIGKIEVKQGSGAYGTTDVEDYVTINDFDNDNIIENAKTDDTSEFTFEVPNSANDSLPLWWNTDKANNLTFRIPVTVEADYAGDITCDVSGAKAGVEDTTVTVGTVESPITVDTSTTEVKNGIQKQNVADITITENYAGYIEKGDTLKLELDNLGLTNALVFDEVEVEVTDGDLEIGKVKINAGIIEISIEETSTKISTISITGLSATLNRTLPEGGYDLLVYGSAVVKNEDYNDDDFTDVAVTSEDYIKIITPAESATVETKIDAKFVIDEASYVNNGESVEMDAAPYIDGNNRTMVPIRYIANACGVKDDDITWNQATLTAIINGANTVVTIKEGDYTLQTSAGPIYMDTVAVNKDGRIYVPARYIANALGADVTWDHDTQTVTITE